MAAFQLASSVHPSMNHAASEIQRSIYCANLVMRFNRSAARSSAGPDDELPDGCAKSDALRAGLAEPERREDQEYEPENEQHRRLHARRV
jgi:hypothetical protein